MIVLFHLALKLWGNMIYEYYIEKSSFFIGYYDNTSSECKSTRLKSTNILIERWVLNANTIITAHESNKNRFAFTHLMPTSITTNGQRLWDGWASGRLQSHPLSDSRLWLINVVRCTPEARSCQRLWIDDRHTLTRSYPFEYRV